jgi:hypothetical protein
VENARQRINKIKYNNSLPSVWLKNTRQSFFYKIKNKSLPSVCLGSARQRNLKKIKKLKLCRAFYKTLGKIKVNDG